MGRWRTRTALWGVALFVLTTGVPLAGAQEGTSPTTTSPDGADDEDLITISVTPPNVNLSFGEEEQFTAISANGEDTVSGPVWMVDHGTITQEGLYTAPDEPALATVTVLLAGGVAHIPVAVNARDQDLITISVTPPSVNLGFGEQEQFTAIGSDQNGNPMHIAPTWETDSGTVSQMGLYTAPDEPGTATVTASVTLDNGTRVDASGGIVITAGTEQTLGSIEVSPADVSITIEVEQTFTALLFDQDGNSYFADIPLTWSTDNGTITQDGTYTAPDQPGTATVTASVTLPDGTRIDAHGGIVITAGTEQTLGSIEVSPADVSITIGTEQTFIGYVYDEAGNRIDGVPLEWSATNGTITQTGTYTAPNQAGTATITATAGDISDSARVNIIGPTGLAWWLWPLAILALLGLVGGALAFMRSQKT